ncbi:HPr kinase/phosphorylase [Marivita sp.]|uniref:HPr kinase/phosphorylase n=1 Tax=Marivita sp. TaxID=2003365 RepID=UPI003F6B82E7
MAEADPLTVHATAVALGDRAVLVTGASGTGKSTLALEMMARGATLVADDQVILTKSDGSVLLSCPEALCGMIEARGVGLLHAAYCSPVALALVVDMEQVESARLPELRTITYFSQTFPLLHKVASEHFPAAILQYLRISGRVEI